MKTFFIDLNEMAHKKSKLYKVWAFGALMFVVFGVGTSMLLKDKVDGAMWPIIIMSAYLLLYIYYAWVTYKAKLYIQADDYAVEYSFGMIKRTAEIIIWDTIVKVKLGPTYVAFFKRSGKRKVVSLGWLPYVKVVDIKEKIRKACEYKGVPFEIVDYNRFEKKSK
ncbi:hypothetical protein CYCD_19170 [Tenuifilaceae bacterium CYCD]|nr:hypothetical protein CYCD_19170 [Tenuifilaceae bacterium CYCD]